MTRLISRWLMLMLLSLFASVALAVVELVTFETPAQEQQYKTLIAELRCVVCQNQNLADSDAPLAKDLRGITAQMIKDGKSNKEIKTFMQQRYGDFVLYRPPLTPGTAFLWIGPIIVLVLAIILVLLRTKRRTEAELLQPTQAFNHDARIKIRNLINEAPRLDGSDLSEKKDD